MLDLDVFTSSDKQTIDAWWKQLRPWLTIGYLVVAVILLVLSASGYIRLLNEVGKVFGGFTWAIDPDNQGGIVVVSALPQTPPLEVATNSLTNTIDIIAVNHSSGVTGLVQAYQHARPGDTITYTVQQNNGTQFTFTRPAVIYTQDMWWQSYGLPLLAGISWLVIGFIVLAGAPEWAGAVEGLTMLPPAMLLLLYSHWGNIQTPYPQDTVFQLLWVPSFALLGAAFIHLSLTFRPETIQSPRKPRMMMDGLPYLPLIVLVVYELSTFFVKGYVPTRTNLILNLGYGGIGGLLSVCIGVVSLVRISRSEKQGSEDGTTMPITPRIRHQVSDLLILWIGGIGLGFGLGVLPMLLTGHLLLPLPVFYTLAAVYPLILWYAIRSLRLIDRLHTTLDQRELALEQRERALTEQQRTAEALYRANSELRRATSLLLHADAHLRSLLSQRIHDQPKQQALRIRSLLGHWQHKLRVEAEHDPEEKVAVKPLIEALGKVRKISEELEGDLRGLQLLVEDAYQRQSLGLKLHLDKLIREDLPALHPESPLKIQVDLWALDALSPDLEQTEQGAKIAEAISYAVTQALLNIYNHAGANFATVRTVSTMGMLEVYITDDGRGFDINAIAPEKTSLFKALLKVREAGGTMTIKSVPRPQFEHGTTIMLRIPLPLIERSPAPEPPQESEQAQVKTPGMDSRK